MPGIFTTRQIKVGGGRVEIKNVCAETSFVIQIRDFSIHCAVEILDKICWFFNLEIGLLPKLIYFDCMIFSLDIHIFWSWVFRLHGVTPFWLLGCIKGRWSWIWWPWRYLGLLDKMIEIWLKFVSNGVTNVVNPSLFFMLNTYIYGIVCNWMYYHCIVPFTLYSEKELGGFKVDEFGLSTTHIF